jgi:hypothetical protein
VDLLEHLEYDLDRFLAYLDDVNPGVETIWSAPDGRGRRGVATVADQVAKQPGSATEPVAR